MESPAYSGRMCGRAGRGVGRPDPAPLLRRKQPAGSAALGVAKEASSSSGAASTSPAAPPTALAKKRKRSRHGLVSWALLLGVGLQHPAGTEQEAEASVAAAAGRAEKSRLVR